MKFNNSLPLMTVVVIGMFITSSLFLNSNIVNACGMTTHNEVARRAFNFSNFEDYPQFQQMILNNLPSFQAGAAFPDWGYSCGGFGVESEAAHWPPFLRNATEYLLETYTKPWNSKAQELVVFLLGVMSHQIADISWHSISGDQNGLIESMAGQDFNGTYSQAHGNADTGGEFVLAYNYNLNWLEDEWHVPVADVKNIYYKMNFTTVTEFALVKCNAMLFAGAMAVKTGGRFLYSEIAEKSPFLVDHYQDYFNGGLDDMAVWTTYCWPVLMGWMEGEKIGNFCAIQPDPSFSRVGAHNNYEEISSHFSEEAINAVWQSINIKQIGEKYVISAEGLTAKGMGFIEPEKKTVADASGNYSTIFSQNPYSYFGRTLISYDLNNDGFDDIIVSAPGDGIPGAMQTGCVYYIIMGEKNSSSFINSAQFEINQIANGKVCGDEIHARFGWSTVLLDFNMDGIIDLVVGAPSSSNADMNYYGKVFVYLGQVTGNQWSVDHSNPIVINGTSFQDQAGLMLFTGDANNDNHPDLIIGMPTAGGIQQGKVAIFYSSTRRNQQHAMDIEADADASLYGTTPFEWFGYHVDVGSGLILVGSPTYHDIDGLLMNTGKITAYELPAAADHTPKFTLYGEFKFDKLGYTFQIVNGTFIGMEENLVVIGLPTRGYEYKEQVGEVLMIPFESLSGNVSIANCEVLMQITGQTSYSRFGESVMMDLYHSEVPTLYVGSPLWTDSISTGSGAVYSYQINPPAKQVRSKTSKRVATVDGGSYVNNKEKDSRFGFKMVLADVNNDGKKDLIIGADRDSSKNLQSGSINIFFSNF